MRGFIVLCLSAMAVAAPQGYNYNPGPSPSGSSGAVYHPAQHQGHTQHHQQQQQFTQKQAIISKRFYIHTAPEEEAETGQEKYITVGTPRKNYNVVFIKAPSKASGNHAIKISPAVNEEKTVIYVLSKKIDASDIQAEVVEQTPPTTKPEVFFIKYKTNEEASHAQTQIQAQYDALGGSSQVVDEGVAPVSSVVGALEKPGASSTSSSTFTSTGGGFTSQGNANNAYLPPSLY